MCFSFLFIPLVFLCLLSLLCQEPKPTKKKLGEEEQEEAPKKKTKQSKAAKEWEKAMVEEEKGTNVKAANSKAKASSLS